MNVPSALATQPMLSARESLLDFMVGVVESRRSPSALRALRQRSCRPIIKDARAVIAPSSRRRCACCHSGGRAHLTINRDRSAASNRALPRLGHAPGSR